MKKIFISSTVFDLKDLRAELATSLEDWGYTPIWSESPDFPKKSGLHSHDICLDEITNCDIYLLIIDKRYGGTYAGNKHPKKNISITWYETEMAVENNKEMYTFVRDEVWNERPTYKKNLKNGVNIEPCHVDNPKVFDFIDYIVQLQRDNWIDSFNTSVNLKTQLKKRLNGSIKLELIKQYIEFIIRHTSCWNISGSMRTLELDHTYISEIIKERLDSVWVDLEEARRMETPVYRDDTLLNYIIEGQFDTADRLSHFLILSEPGFGKTTLMFQWANLIAKRWIGSGNGFFPIWVPFKNWAALTSNQYGPPHLTKAAATISNVLQSDLLAKFLDEIMHQGNAIVFLDGFDEMFSEQRRYISSVFPKLNDKYPNTRFIVTSRKASYTGGLPNYKKFEILAFSNEQIEKLVERYFSGNPAQYKAMLKELSINERFYDLAKTPLFLTIMCLVFEAQESLPKNETDLYSICLKLLIHDIPADKGITGLDRRDIFSSQQPPDTNEILVVLQAIARESFVQEKDPLPNDEVIKAAKQALNVIGSSKDPQGVVDFIEINTELIKKIDQISLRGAPSNE